MYKLRVIFPSRTSPTSQVSRVGKRLGERANTPRSSLKKRLLNSPLSPLSTVTRTARFSQHAARLASRPRLYPHSIDSWPILSPAHYSFFSSPLFPSHTESGRRCCASCTTSLCSHRRVCNSPVALSLCCTRSRATRVRKVRRLSPSSLPSPPSRSRRIGSPPPHSAHSLFRLTRLARSRVFGRR